MAGQGRCWGSGGAGSFRGGRCRSAVAELNRLEGGTFGKSEQAERNARPVGALEDESVAKGRGLFVAARTPR